MAIPEKDLSTDTPSASRPQLTLWKATALGFAAMQVGPCLAAVPTLLQQFGGPGSWISALLTLAVAVMIARAITTFARRYVVEGSLVSYAKIAFGPTGEHIVGVSLILGYFGLVSSLVNDEIYYLTSILQELGFAQSASFGWQCMLAIVASLFTAFFAYRGPDLSARVSGLLAAISLPIVVAITVVAFIRMPQGFALQFEPAELDFDGIIKGAIWGLSIYVGFDGLTSVASDTENPRKYVPAILTAVLIFFGVTCSLGSILQFSVLAPAMDDILAGQTAISVLADAAGMGDYVFLVDLTLCAAGVASSIAFFNFGARIVSLSAQDGMLPAILGRVDPKTHAPRPAIALVCGVGALVPILIRISGSVSPIDAITTLGSIMLYFWLLPYWLICLGAVVILRRTAGSMRPEMILPTLGGAALIGVVAQSVVNDWRMPAIALAILLAILALLKLHDMRVRPLSA